MHYCMFQTPVAYKDSNFSTLLPTLSFYSAVGNSLPNGYEVISHYPIYPSFFFLDFELRALRLLGKCSTTWATPPACIFSYASWPFVYLLQIYFYSSPVSTFELGFLFLLLLNFSISLFWISEYIICKHFLPFCGVSFFLIESFDVQIFD
jgi:hypothetical protein